MRAVIPKSLFLIALVYTSSTLIVATRALANTSLKEMGCTIQLDGIHQEVSCLEKAEVLPPVASTSCGAAVTLTFDDQYFRLGCAVSGFQEYFSLSHWTVNTINGDGGVDVTGAPNSLLVEGANKASVVVTPRSAASYGIAIPADGYVSFDWSYIGGSNLFTTRQFWVDINGEQAAVPSDAQDSGQFFSSRLAAGDVLSINVEAQEEGFELTIANFEFLSNAVGVIERDWKAEDENGGQGFFKQFVSIKKPRLSLVTFPENYDGFEFPILGPASGTSPDWTGYPVIDKDGLLSTTHDQFSLQGSNAPMQVNWEDESLFSDGICVIYRKWTITDLCGSNVLEHTQVIKFSGGCPENGGPLPYGLQPGPGEAPQHENDRLAPAITGTGDNNSWGELLETGRPDTKKIQLGQPAIDTKN